MDPLILSISLMMLGIFIIVLELFLPSGGVLGVLAGLCIIASIIVAYSDGNIYRGTIMLAVAALVLPMLIAGAIKLWPNTPIGRRVLIGRPQSHDVLPDSEEYQVLKSLVGRRGTAKGEMLPSGIVVIDGREHDATSVGMPITAGRAIIVVDVQTNHIVVRPVGDNEVLAMKEPAEETEEDMLSRPLDSLGLDPFDDDPLT